MCGISVAIETGSISGPLGPVLAKMHEALAHRGPDGEGYLWLDSGLHPTSTRGERMPQPAIPDDVRIAAAFRWLKIQDLNFLSSQPMSACDGKHWILFNGEIYNHNELRAEFARSGEQFRSQSDTEVVLTAYRRWGRDCFSRLVGMWAIVIIDLVRREAVISRDRLGIKPLYYSFQGTRLLLASEPKAIALSGDSASYAEPFRVHEFLRGLPPQSAELSFFRDISPLPAGTWATIRLDGTGIRKLEPQRFWNLADIRAEDLPESAFEQKREEFESLLTDSLECHSNAAVEVGALLSGGMDTSILARLLAAYAKKKGAEIPKTFSIIFEDPGMSEWPYMQLVLAKGGLKGFNYVLTSDMAWESTARVVNAQGQPLRCWSPTRCF